MIEILLEQRRGIRMVDMQGLIVVTGDCRRVVTHRAVDPEELPETGDGHKQAVAVFLHF